MDTEKIPIYEGREPNKRIACYAIVDQEDFAIINQDSWHLADGYAIRSFQVGNRVIRIPMHLEVLFINGFEYVGVDHINRDRLDNRKANLRNANHAENMQNKNVYKNSKSGLRGVAFDRRRQRWAGQIRKGGKVIFRMYSDNQAEVVDAVRDARRRLLAFAVD